MSRSYKKHPIIKDRQKEGNLHNKIFRRKNKILINTDQEPKQQKEVYNQYDICDWAIRMWNKEIIKK